MNSYASLRHEVTSLQALRIVHYVTDVPKSWLGSAYQRNFYWENLLSRASLKPFQLLSAKIEKLYLFNPTDLGRWVGGGPFAVPIEGSRRSRLLPAAFVLTMCGGNDVDACLREELSRIAGANAQTGTEPNYKYEALSWMAFNPPVGAGDDLTLTSPFRLVKEPERDSSRSPQVALVMFQCRVAQELDDAQIVFKDICQIEVGDVTWQPTVVGLLKGNVDAFAILEERLPAGGRSRHSTTEFDELVLQLEEEERIRSGSSEKSYWAGIRPVAIYGASSPTWARENLALLSPLQQGGGGGALRGVDGQPAEEEAQ